MHHYLLGVQACWVSAWAAIVPCHFDETLLESNPRCVNGKILLWILMYPPTWLDIAWMYGVIASVWLITHKFMHPLSGLAFKVAAVPTFWTLIIFKIFLDSQSSPFISLIVLLLSSYIQVWYTKTCDKPLVETLHFWDQNLPISAFLLSILWNSTISKWSITSDIRRNRCRLSMTVLQRNSWWWDTLYCFLDLGSWLARTIQLLSYWSR